MTRKSALDTHYSIPTQHSGKCPKPNHSPVSRLTEKRERTLRTSCNAAKVSGTLSELIRLKKKKKKDPPSKKNPTPHTNKPEERRRTPHFVSTFAEPCAEHHNQKLSERLGVDKTRGEKWRKGVKVRSCLPGSCACAVPVCAVHCTDDVRHAVTVLREHRDRLAVQSLSQSQ